MARAFVVREEFVKIVEKYIALRPENLQTDRFFINYQRGKCVRQVIGKNKISCMPKQIATFLNIPNPSLYTGHCFRRTSATLLADSGADLTMLKRHGGWKSSTVAEGYIEDSIQNKSKIYSKITETIKLRPTSPRPGTSKETPPYFSVVTNLPAAAPAAASTISSTYTSDRIPSPTYTDIPFNDTQISQKIISNVNIPGKNISLSFSNCTIQTINFK